ncbi:MAG: tetratricopeptide repeat protein [Ferruginibacter sp.]
MKKTVVSIAFILFAVSALAQDAAALKKHYLKMYNNALNWNDANAAISALHGYLALDDNLAYKDTLSMLYFSSKSYISALILSEEVYKNQPANPESGARAAECYDNLGDPKTAVKLFEEVAAKTRNPYHIYKMAVCQYELKRTLECEQSSKRVLADTNSNKIGVGFENGNGSSQTVPVNAAASNLLGVLQMDAKNYAAAKNYFNEALKAFPQFTGAKQNLEAVDNAMKAAGKPAAKPQARPKGK